MKQPDFFKKEMPVPPEEEESLKKEAEVAESVNAIEGELPTKKDDEKLTEKEGGKPVSYKKVKDAGRSFWQKEFPFKKDKEN